MGGIPVDDPLILRLGCGQAVGDRVDVSRECIAAHQQSLERGRAPSAERVDYQIFGIRQFIDPFLRFSANPSGNIAN